MRLTDLGEAGFVDRITPGCVSRPQDVVSGIGDDCAVTRGSQGNLRLVTTDLMVEGVHFLRAAIRPWQLGAKALAVNLSDVAAMGGRPLDAYVSIAVPKDVSVEDLDALYDGMKGMARRFDVNILGGDTTASPAGLFLNVALTGEVAADRVLYRSGARPGDALFVSGFLGDSKAGLDVLLRDEQGGSAVAAELLRRHHEPAPHVREGQAVAATRLAHAAMDVSDGLAADLPRLCARSGVGAEVHEARLPVSPELVAYCAARGLDPTAMAVAGGEDYVLLLAGEPALPDVLAGRGVTLHAIGRVVEGGGPELVRRNGSRVPLAGGWDHFRSAR